MPPAIENPRPDVPRSRSMSSYCQLSSPFTCGKDLFLELYAFWLRGVREVKRVPYHQ